MVKSSRASHTGISGSITVLHVIESFLAGSLYSVRNLTNMLAAHSTRQVILHAIRNNTPVDYADQFDPRVELIHWPAAIREISPASDLEATREFWAALSRVEPHVVHCYSAKAGFICRMATPLNVPVLYSPHGFPFQGAFSRTAAAYYGLEFIAGLLPGRITLASGQSESRAARRVLHRVVTLPNIVELDRFLALDPPLHPDNGIRPRIVTTGLLREHKNPRLFADIARAMEGADFIWIGGAVDDYQFNPVPKNMRITGWKSRDEIAGALSRADIFLQTSIGEGMSNSLLEAMAAGLPCIVTNVPGNRDLVRSDTGNLFGENAEGFRNHLVRLLNSPDERFRLGNRNRDWIIANYDNEANMHRYFQLYQSLAQGRGIPRHL